MRLGRPRGSGLARNDQGRRTRQTATFARHHSQRRSHDHPNTLPHCLLSYASFATRVSVLPLGQWLTRARAALRFIEGRCQARGCAGAAAAGPRERRLLCAVRNDRLALGFRPSAGVGLALCVAAWGDARTAPPADLPFTERASPRERASACTRSRAVVSCAGPGPCPEDLDSGRARR
jgi:hypothetical protein